MSDDPKKAEDAPSITRSTPVPDHQSYGGSERDEVAGGPAGRGNDVGATVDPNERWGRNEKPKEEKVPVKGTDRQNVFSR